MHAIESKIFERLHNCENVKYIIMMLEMRYLNFKKKVNQMAYFIYLIHLVFIAWF